MKKIINSLVRKKRKKESWLKYITFLLHLWLGLLSSIIVFVICLTGCLYAFKNQINDWYNHDKVYAKTSHNTPLSVNQIQQLFEQDNKEIQSLVIPESSGRNWIISYLDLNTQYQKTEYVNPSNGERLGSLDRGLDSFFQIILNLHKNLMLGSTGKQIVGASTLIFMALLISGLILWWPKNKRGLKNGLLVKWNARFYRLNYDLHNTLGFYSLIFLLFISLTGVYITYPWIKNGIIVSLGGDPVLSFKSDNGQDKSQSSFDDVLKDILDKEEEKSTLENIENIPIEEILSLSEKHLPYKATTTIQLPNKENPRYVVTKINTSNWMRAEVPDIVSFDKKGELKSIERFTDKSLSTQFIKLSLPLHTGEFMGLPTIILYFIITLIGCSLPVTGFIIWLKKLK